MRFKILCQIWCVILSPMVFIVMLPIEWPIWKTYKTEGYNVPGYVKFFWNRCIILKDQHYEQTRCNSCQAARHNS